MSNTNREKLFKKKRKELPRPGRALGDEVIPGDNELADAENAFLFESGDCSRACDSLHGSLEGFVELLRKNHLFLSQWGIFDLWFETLGLWNVGERWNETLDFWKRRDKEESESLEIRKQNKEVFWRYRERTYERLRVQFWIDRSWSIEGETTSCRPTLRHGERTTSVFVSLRIPSNFHFWKWKRRRITTCLAMWSCRWQLAICVHVESGDELRTLWSNKLQMLYYLLCGG